MKIFHIIILLFICAAPLTGMTVTDSLIPYRLDDKWGFADVEGAIRITPQYDSVRRFQGGLAVVGINDAFGFVNLSGEEVISLKYENVTDYDTLNRRIEVTLNGKYQVIDEFGERIRGITMWKREVIWDCVSFGYGYGGAIYEKNGMYGFVEWVCNGSVDSCKKYKEPEFTDFKGFGNYIAAVQKGDKWAIVGFHATGYYITPFEYDQVLVDETDPVGHNTLTIVVKDYKYGYIDSEGEVIVQPKYDNAHFFENGLAKVFHNGRWGYINRSGIEYFHDN